LETFRKEANALQKDFCMKENAVIECEEVLQLGFIKKNEQNDKVKVLESKVKTLEEKLGFVSNCFELLVCGLCLLFCLFNAAKGEQTAAELEAKSLRVKIEALRKEAAAQGKSL